MIEGFAAAEGTARYRDRFPILRDAGHLRRQPQVPGAGDLWLSSIGLGTYLGDMDDAADARYTEAVRQALRCGINVLDTAINYRHQRSERNIGAALASLLGEVQRDEVLICTKAGYLTFDGNMPSDPQAYFTREYVEKGVLDPREVVSGSHCLAPKYLANQLERSWTNLGLATIDVFYLHNPETQLGAVSRATFQERMRTAFEFCEGAVNAGKIRFYGAATWAGFRTTPGDPQYLSLEELVQLARQVAGDEHHFRFVQAPFSLAMPEAYAYGNQAEGSLLATAAALGVIMVGSASLVQGQLLAQIPSALKAALRTELPSHTALQFARSAPGLATALVGMGRPEHVIENVALAEQPPTPAKMWEGLFQAKE